jgi:hypothetical protein
MHIKVNDAPLETRLLDRRRLLATFVVVSISTAVPAQVSDSTTRKLMDTQNKRSVYLRYLSAWSAMSDAERLQAIVDTTLAEVSYVDASAKFTGQTELAAHLAGFQKRRPNYSFSIGSFLQHRDMALVNWQMLDPTGNIVVRGYDYVLFNGSGLISSIAGFSDTAAQRLEP